VVFACAGEGLAVFVTERSLVRARAAQAAPSLLPLAGPVCDDRAYAFSLSGMPSKARTSFGWPL